MFGLCCTKLRDFEGSNRFNQLWLLGANSVDLLWLMSVQSRSLVFSANT